MVPPIARYPQIGGALNNFRGSAAAGLLFHTLSGNTITPVVATGSDTPTFTRATDLIYIDQSDGYMETASSGNAGFETDGIIAQEQRTNLTLQSRTHATTWTSENLTVTNNNATGADNAANTASTLRETTADAQHKIRQNITCTANANYAMSCVAKSVGSRDVALYLYERDAFSDFAAVFFDLPAGTVGGNNTSGTGSVVSSKITSLSGSWYLCECVVTIGGGHTSMRQECRVAASFGDSSYPGNTSNGLDLWYVGLEDDQDFATRPIQTTSSSATRNKDQLTYSAASNITAATGSITFTAGVLNIAQRMTFIDTRNSSGLNGVLVYMDTSAQTNFEVYDGSGLVMGLTDTANDFAVGTTKDIEVRWAANDYELKTDSVSRATNTSDTGVPASHDIIRLFEDENNANQLNGHMEELKIYDSVVV